MRPGPASIPHTVNVSPEQMKEINRRAGLRPFDGKARAEYLIGCALDEPRDQLLKRVAEIRDAERARFGAEIKRERRRSVLSTTL